MFKRKTLFIVGAGASAEVGLPVGATLAKTIANILNVPRGGMPDSRGETVLRQLYEKRPLSSNGYQQAAWRIRDGVRLTNSIDDFLDMHGADKLVQRVGKTAIVKAILDAEAESSLYYDRELSRQLVNLDKIENTWFMKFFRMLGRGVTRDNARQIFDSVSFIVFNYDRCLEFFLLSALQLVYSMPQSEAVSIVSNLRIIHPYGMVAGLPLTGSGVPFGGTPGFELDYVGPAEGIKTYSEQIAAGDMLTQIHEEMSAAEQFVFLGFGYHDQNMLMLKPGKQLPLKPVLGTALDRSESDIEVIRQQLAQTFSGGLQGIIPAMQIANRTSAALFDYYAKTLPN